MKKVLILSVIAMLALGVFALAAGLPAVPGTTYAGESHFTYNPFGYVNGAQQGPTCQSTSLVVYSIIGIEQGYVATATSYDASFCGATGNPLTTAYTDSGYLLAKLSVESNMDSIGVTVSNSVYGPDGSDLTSYLPAGSITYSNGNSGSLSLSGGSANTPYSGMLYVYGPATIPAWITAGRYMLVTTFTITPANTF